MSKAYQKTTGIAGYTLVSSSHYLALVEHKPYSPLQEDGTQEFHTPKYHLVEVREKRQLVADTEKGKELAKRIESLKALIMAYREGDIKEKY
jgi:fructose-1,6-bisphosphatase-3